MRTRSLSVRARLTLWNVAVVALTLTFFGIVLRFSVERLLIGGLDRDLQRRAQPLAQMVARPLPPPFDNRRGIPLDDGGGMRPDPRLAPPPEISPPPDGRRFPEHRRGGGGRRPPRREPFPPRVLGRDGNDLGPRNGPGRLRPWSLAGFETALRQQRSNFRREEGQEGEPLRVFSLPVQQREGEVVVVQAAAPIGEAERALRGLTLTLLALLPAALLVAGLGGAWLTERALRPIRDITRAAAQIGEGNLAERLPVESADEFGWLAGILNGMLGRLEEAFLRQRRFTADASHELRTPLAVIKAHSSLALEDAEGENRETLRAIDDAADRANRIVRDLLFLARAESGSVEALPVHLSTVNISGLFRSARQSVLTAATQNMDKVALPPVEDQTEGEILFHSDPDLLLRLLTNLLENAVRYTPPTGKVIFAARRMAENVTLTLTDTGEGIAPEHLPRLMEPFYRADAARTRKSGGAGLGLAICQGIVRALGGTLHIESQIEKGTVITVILPAGDS